MWSYFRSPILIFPFLVVFALLLPLAARWRRPPYLNPERARLLEILCPFALFFVSVNGCVLYGGGSYIWISVGLFFCSLQELFLFSRPDMAVRASLLAQLCFIIALVFMTAFAYKILSALCTCLVVGLWLIVYKARREVGIAALLVVYILLGGILLLLVRSLEEDVAAFDALSFGFILFLIGLFPLWLQLARKQHKSLHLHGFRQWAGNFGLYLLSIAVWLKE